MKSGISLNTADRLRELWEENGYCLSSSTHLRQLVPFVLYEEIKTIQQEIYFVAVLRFVDDWSVKQRVSKLMLLAKSLTGENVACPLVESLSTELGIASHLSI